MLRSRCNRRTDFPPLSTCLLSPLHRHTPISASFSGDIDSLGGPFTWSPQNVAQGSLIMLGFQRELQEEDVAAWAAWEASGRHGRWKGKGLCLSSLGGSKLSPSVRVGAHNMSLKQASGVALACG